MLSNLNRDNYQPYSPPEEKSAGGTVILISVAGVILILIVGLALLWRGRRKRSDTGMDEWGLPIRVLVRSMHLSMHTLSASLHSLRMHLAFQQFKFIPRVPAFCVPFHARRNGSFEGQNPAGES